MIYFKMNSNSEIYEPAEDSYLLSDVLKKNIVNKNSKCLEIGSGSGVQLKTLKKIGIKNLTGADINKSAVAHCKKLGFNCIYSDLFSKIPKTEKFDIIIFNPPYLPLDKREPLSSRTATTGGKKGSEIINKFLKQSKDYLNKNGKMFLLTSSLTKDIDFKDYNKKLLGKEKIFMEELYVWELTQ